MGMQQIRTIIAGQLAIIIMLFLSSCGGDREEAPRATVDDPRAYAIEALQTMDLNTWWQAYRNTDPELLGQIVDDVAEKLPDGLPTDARKLDTAIRHRIAQKYKLYMDDTDEGKAYICHRRSDRSNMELLLRKSQHADLPFLREMLYEAVFWRVSANKPSFEEGLAYPEVRKSLADWGERDGDAAVVATVDLMPVGAAWYRFCTENNAIRGYVDENTPVLVIGVHRDYRHQGVGTKMIAWLLDYASKHAIQNISLSVSKDNHAINLYRQQGFLEVADMGDAFLMVRKI